MPFFFFSPMVPGVILDILSICPSIWLYFLTLHQVPWLIYLLLEFSIACGSFTQLIMLWSILQCFLMNSKPILILINKNKGFLNVFIHSTSMLLRRWALTIWDK